MGWYIYIVVSLVISFVAAELVSIDIESQANDLTWNGIPKKVTLRRAARTSLATLVVLFSVLIGAGYFFTHVEIPRGSSTTYLGHDWQSENGQAIYTGN